MNYLFVCSRNQWRSRTAETIFKNNGTHKVKSAGTTANARVKLSAKLVAWADIIFVMENKHADHIRRNYRDMKSSSMIKVLHISDIYEYMDLELIDILKYDLKYFF